MATPRSAPDLKIPSSNHTVSVSIIDTTAKFSMPASIFMEPDIKGNEMLRNCCCFSFLIKHDNPEKKTKHDTLVFDLGVRKDFENGPTALVNRFAGAGIEVNIEKNVVDILKDNGEDPEKVGGIMWSHAHMDHTGDPSTFPSSTDLIVGPGFKKAFVPAWPTIPDAEVDEKAYEGRTLTEISFTESGNQLKIGQYNAIDFYGDGSFYLLDTPGHAVGHMCGLARTNAEPPQFILMGGDIAHHGSEFRPTPYIPLPETISPSPLAPPFTKAAPACLGSVFEKIHPKGSRTEPFTTPKPGLHLDVEETKKSIEKMYEFDAAENIFVNIAHDTSLMGVVDLFPKTANGWSEKGWKTEGRWRFLGDFDAE